MSGATGRWGSGADSNPWWDPHGNLSRLPEWAKRVGLGIGSVYPWMAPPTAAVAGWIAGRGPRKAPSRAAAPKRKPFNPTIPDTTRYSGEQPEVPGVPGRQFGPFPGFSPSAPIAPPNMNFPAGRKPPKWGDHYGSPREFLKTSGQYMDPFNMKTGVSVAPVNYHGELEYLNRMFPRPQAPNMSGYQNNVAQAFSGVGKGLGPTSVSGDKLNQLSTLPSLQEMGINFQQPSLTVSGGQRGPGAPGAPMDAHTRALAAANAAANMRAAAISAMGAGQQAGYGTQRGLATADMLNAVSMQSAENSNLVNQASEAANARGMGGQGFGNIDMNTAAQQGEAATSRAILSGMTNLQGIGREQADAARQMSGAIGQAKATGADLYTQLYGDYYNQDRELAMAQQGMQNEVVNNANALQIDAARARGDWATNRANIWYGGVGANQAQWANQSDNAGRIAQSMNDLARTDSQNYATGLNGFNDLFGTLGGLLSQDRSSNLDYDLGMRNAAVGMRASDQAHDVNAANTINTGNANFNNHNMTGYAADNDLWGNIFNNRSTVYGHQVDQANNRDSRQLDWIDQWRQAMYPEQSGSASDAGFDWRNSPFSENGAEFNAQAQIDDGNVQMGLYLQLQKQFGSNLSLQNPGVANAVRALLAKAQQSGDPVQMSGVQNLIATLGAGSANQVAF